MSPCPVPLLGRCYRTGDRWRRWHELAGSYSPQMVVGNISLQIQRNYARRHTVTRREDITGVVVLDGAIARAARTRLSGRNGPECRERDDRKKLLDG